MVGVKDEDNDDDDDDKTFERREPHKERDV
jgi:hypothetical protein